jgi:16S rRNA (adenine(1408)-N(1))-methyltransferase
VLARAATEPGALVIGMDASASAMADASRRAARAPRKGGPPNALFVVAAAEVPPVELTAVASLITVILPWGSLFDGVIGTAPSATAGLASLLTPGGAIEVLLSVEARDGLPTDVEPSAIAEAWCRHGIDLVTARPATDAEIAATPSTWARRLRLGRDRSAWRLVLRRQVTRRADGR